MRKKILYRLMLILPLLLIMGREGRSQTGQGVFQAGNWLGFDGMDDRVEMNSGPAIGQGVDFTIECWIRPEADSGTVFCRKGGSGRASVFWFGLKNGYLAAELSDGLHTLDFLSNQPVVVGDVRHIALTADFSLQDSTMKVSFFLNGEEAGSAGGPAVILDASAQSFVGGGCNEEPAFEGFMDEFRIWRTAMPQHILAAFMKWIPTDMHPSVNSLALWYQFNQSYTFEVDDQTGLYNGHFTGDYNPQWETSAIPLTGASFGAMEYTVDFSGGTPGTDTLTVDVAVAAGDMSLLEGLTTVRYGVCYSQTNPLPQYTDNFVSDFISGNREENLSFSQKIGGLFPGQKVYLRPFYQYVLDPAQEVVYGDVVQTETLPLQPELLLKNARTLTPDTVCFDVDVMHRCTPQNVWFYYKSLLDASPTRIKNPQQSGNTYTFKLQKMSFVPGVRYDYWVEMVYSGSQGNTLKVESDTLVYQAPRILGSGFDLTFGGSDTSNVEIPDAASFDHNGSFTIEAWIKPGDHNGDALVFVKGDGSAPQYSLALNNANKVYGAFAENYPATPLCSNQSLTSGAWQYIAVVVDYNPDTEKSTQKIYCGKQIDEQYELDGMTPLNQAAVFIGKGFTESIDELRVWTTALPDSVIKKYYRQSVDETHPAWTSLAAYYTFNEHGSEYLWDQSGNNNNGILNGDHTWEYTGCDSINDDQRAFPDIRIATNDSSYKYHLNNPAEYWYEVSELPPMTTSVFFNFTDANGKPVHEPYSATVTNQSARWDVQMTDYDIPFSAQLKISLLYKDGGYTRKAKYLIPMIIISDSLSADASAGWGPFVTDNYPAVAGADAAQPSVFNTFTIWNFPPRTRGVALTFTDDQARPVCDTLMNYFAADDFLTTNRHGKTTSYVQWTCNMSHLPLNTTHLAAVTWSEGSSIDGDTTLYPLLINPVAPQVSITNTGNYAESNRQSAQSLKFYSQNTRHRSEASGAVITNSPGLRTVLAKGVNVPMKGPYSFHLLNDSFTFEMIYYLEVQEFSQVSGSLEIPLGKVADAWGANLTCNYNNGGFSNPAFRFNYGPGLQQSETINLNTRDFTVNQYHHLALTLSNGQLTLYHDGNVVGSKPVGAYQAWFADSLLTKPFRLGGSVGGYDRDINLMLDECRLWNIARSPEEIAAHMFKTVKPESNLIGYWNFDDPMNKGYKVWDKSMTPNHGTLSNGLFHPQKIRLDANTQDMIASLSLASVDSLQFRFIDHQKNVLGKFVAQQKKDGRFAAGVDLASIPCDTRFILTEQFYTVDGNSRKVSRMVPFRILPGAPELKTKYDFKSIFASTNAKEDAPRIYNPFVLTKFPRQTGSVQCFIRNRESKQIVMHSDVFTQSTIPFDHSLWFGGNSDDEAISNQTVDLPEIFTVALWFRTTEKQGGKLLGIEDATGMPQHTVYVDTNGFVRMAAPAGDGFVYVLTDSEVNDGDWHHLAVTSNGESFRMYIDGSLIDCKMNQQTNAASGILHIGGGSLDGLLDVDAADQAFRGSVAEVSLWNVACSYKLINERMFFPADTASTALMHYYSCDATAGTPSITDLKGDADASLTGTHRWIHQQGIKSTGWNVSLMQLPAGIYDLYCLVKFAGYSGSGFTYYIDSYQNKNPLNSSQPSVHFDYALSDGLGYFDQGMVARDTLSFSTNWQSENGTPNQVYLALYDSTGTELQHQTFEYTAMIDDNWVMQLEGAAPGSFIEMCFGNAAKNNWEHTISQQLFVMPMAPPVVTGNWDGPYTQSIVPGVMTDSAWFNIATVADGINRILVTAFNSNDEEILHTYARRVDDENWGVNVDMGDMEPPYSYLVFDTYLGNNEVSSFTFTSPHIDILDIRPAFVKTALEYGPGLEDGYLSDTLQEGDTAQFRLSISLPVAGSEGEEEEMEFEVPAIVPMMGGEVFCNNRPVLEMVPFTYHVNEDLLECDQNMEITLSQKAFEGFSPGIGKFLEKHKFKVSVESGAEFGINEENEFWYSQEFEEQFGLSKGAGAMIESICVAFEEGLYTAEEAVKMAFGPISEFFWFDFKFGYTGAEKLTIRSKLGYDYETNQWGSAGNTDISFEDDEAKADNASFWYFSIAPGMDFKAGLEILSGIFELNMVVICDVPFGGGHAWTNLPEPDNKTLFATGWSVYFKMVTEELFGMYEQVLFGPTQLLHGNFGTPDYWDLMAIPPKLQAPAQSMASLTEPVRVSWFNRQPVFQPRAHFVSSNGNTGIVWFDLDHSDVRVKALKCQAINPNNGQLREPMTINRNRNVMHSAAATFVDSTRLLSACVKNVRSADDYPAEKLDLKDLGVNQKILVSLSNPVTGEVTDSCELETRLSRPGITACGKPQVAHLSGSRFMVAWIQADVTNETGRLLYAVVDIADHLQVTETGVLTAPPASITFSPRLLRYSDAGDLMAVWQQKALGQDFDYNLMSTRWNGQAWEAPEVLAESTPATKVTNYDLDGRDGHVVLTYIENVRQPQPGDHLATIFFREYDLQQQAWLPAEPVKQVDKGSAGRIRAALSESGTAALIYDHSSVNPNLVSGQKINQLDLLLRAPGGTWQDYEASSLVCDTLKYVSDFDIAAYRDDRFMVLSHEHYWAVNDPVITNPLNGTKFGNDRLNLVLRGFAFDGQDIQETALDTLFADVDEKPVLPELQSGFLLYQNAPNPAGDATNIRVLFRDDCEATLELIDLNGNVLHRFYRQHFNQGLYETAMNLSGLKPGIYILRLSSGKESQSVKMIKK